MDPIEKKPLYHFYPGSLILSVGSFGCNLNCSFCQNYSIAHGTPPTEYLDPGELAELTRRNKIQGSIGLAFTYNEPSIWYEYIMAVAPVLRDYGLKNILVTNGYIEAEPFQKLLPYLDACNIDVKAFNHRFYPEMCKGRIEYVKKTVERAIATTHVEITTLIIPGKNDAVDEIRGLAKWLAGLDKNVVLHLSRYHPAYKLELPPTPVETMLRSYSTAREFLNFVYLGNLPGENNQTNCLICGQELIHRDGYRVTITGTEKGKCINCNNGVDYIIGA
jgi:pyruvate formate lyase activating enzyme